MLTSNGGWIPVDLPAGSEADAGVNSPAVTAIKAPMSPGVSPLYWLGFFVVFLIILHVIGRFEKSGLDPQIMSVGVWNWVAGGLMSATFILVLKLSANKYVPASSFTRVVNVI